MSLLTSRAHRRPVYVRLINGVGRLLQQSGLPPVDLSAASLMAAASRKTGLTAWGDTDFLIPLGKLLTSLEEEACLTPLGRLTMRMFLIERLANRLLIHERLQRHPEILQEPIRRPLLIVSLPRTGTTLLHHLLAQDPVNRTPRFWETLQPVPLSDADPAHSAPHRVPRREPRMAEAKRFAALAACIVPELAVIHPLLPTDPSECILLMENSFNCQSFELQATVDRYIAWLDQQEMTSKYTYLYQQLQILQHQAPQQRWVLKSPYHLCALDSLLAVFPDACIVQTHRDPVEAIASTCSLFATMRRGRSDHVDCKQIGAEVLTRMRRYVEDAMAARARADARRFYDIDYRQLVAEPLTVVQQLYAHFGYRYDERVEAPMRQWLTQNPQHKHGVHHYALAQFGLEKTEITQAFAAYYAQFVTI